MASRSENNPGWLLLIHQIPPKPGYFRVKIWRRLQQIGAVAVKQSVYVMPDTPQAHEDLSWTLKQIVEGGGEASLCEARFLEGLTDEQVMALFKAARQKDFEEIIQEVGTLQKDIEADPAYTAEGAARFKPHLARLQARLDQLLAIDFFPSPQRSVAEMALENLGSLLKGTPESETAPAARIKELKGQTWVTRENVFVDRIACAWLIRRFVDPGAEFKFVRSKKYRPQAGELRFDMFEAEFTHAGDHCSFEVLVDRFGLAEPALGALAEIVHDIDLKDSKFGRTEAMGIASLVAGIALAHRDDDKRLERASTIFEDLYEYFRRKGHVKGPPSKALGTGRKGEHVT